MEGEGGRRWRRRRRRSGKIGGGGEGRGEEEWTLKTNSLHIFPHFITKNKQQKRGESYTISKTVGEVSSWSCFHTCPGARSLHLYKTGSGKCPLGSLAHQSLSQPPGLSATGIFLGHECPLPIRPSPGHLKPKMRVNDEAKSTVFLHSVGNYI